jgi:hypothetical protein
VPGYSTWYHCAAIFNNIGFHPSRTFGNDLQGTVNICTEANSFQQPLGAAKFHCIFSAPSGD